MFLNSPKMRVAVVGGGLVGLCAALRLSEANAHVSIFDAAQPGEGASWAAAGMLAPAYESAAEPGAHPQLFDLCVAGATAWKAFGEWIEDKHPGVLSLDGPGALACAVTAQQVANLDSLAKAMDARQVAYNRLDGCEARKADNNLSPNVLAALEMPTDQQVDNWGVLSALKTRLNEVGVPIHANQTVDRLSSNASGWDIPGFGVFDKIVWATGVDAAAQILIDGVPVQLCPDSAIVPVKGQLLSIAPSPVTPHRVLRFGAGYVAPKASRVVIGATSEWGVNDRSVTDEATILLRQQAAEICPGLAHGDIQMAWAGVRPGTPDHAPIIGRTQFDGIVLAAGHYRNGILLSPLTGEYVRDILLEKDLSPLAEAFSVERFL